MANNNPALEFLATTRIGEKGQLTVPKEFRSELGLGAGAPFTVLRLGNGLILLPEQQRFEQLCEQISSQLTAAGLKPKDAVALLGEARTRVYARHYGKPRAGVRRVRAHRQK
jgi:AbrB family looped-hinge helix DNA binding protein